MRLERLHLGLVVAVVGEGIVFDDGIHPGFQPPGDIWESAVADNDVMTCAEKAAGLRQQQRITLGTRIAHCHIVEQKAVTFKR